MRQGRLLPARYNQRPAGKGNVQTGSELSICQVFATHCLNLGGKEPTGASMRELAEPGSPSCLGPLRCSRLLRARPLCSLPQLLGSSP